MIVLLTLWKSPDEKDVSPRDVPDDLCAELLAFREHNTEPRSSVLRDTLLPLLQERGLCRDRSTDREQATALWVEHFTHFPSVPELSLVTY